MCNCNCSNGVCNGCKDCNDCKKFTCRCSKFARVLVFIGGLNWGLYGVGMLMGTNLNVVNLVVGGMPTLEAIVYIVVGVSTLVMIFGCPGHMKSNSPSANPTM